MKKRIFYVCTIILFLISCGGNDDAVIPSGDNDTNDSPQNNLPPQENTTGWLVPIEDVKDGGPGKDGIPSIDSPQFVTASDSEASFLSDDDLVIGIVVGNSVKAYPHLILDWHEIVNDVVGGKSVSISYCPLTGTAFGWDSVSNNESSTFGVSGLLYNANLILYDRATDSNWSQIGLKCINGDQIGDIPSLVKVIETNWGTWKTLYPNTKVLTRETGFNRNYNYYPYGDYKTNNGYFIFTASPSNLALPNKERIYAIIDGKESQVFRFETFTGGLSVKGGLNGKEYLIVGNENLITAFELNSKISDLDFEYDFNNSEVFFKDNEGNKWNVFGEAVEGPRDGEFLKPATSVVSYWFAIAAFYPDPDVFRTKP